MGVVHAIKWVLVLSGRAVVAVAGRATALDAGDHLLIPAGASHRVTFTDRDRPTVWLAIHLGEDAPVHPA